MVERKTRVLVIYGGRSAEHEISCRSAAFVLRNLNPEKYDVHALAIDQSGRWLPQNTRTLVQNLGSAVAIDHAVSHAPSLTVSASDPSTALLASVGGWSSADPNAGDIVVFPVLHGTYGEDGTLQGLLEMADLAYVGSDHLGSAVGMDKTVAKRLAEAAGVPVVPWVSVTSRGWDKKKREILERIGQLGFPVFVKPARLGSSVGITKVHSTDQIDGACLKALEYDDKILIEKGVDAREIECAVMGGEQPEVSLPGEVIPSGEFYSYDAKYLDEAGAKLAIPAKLDVVQVEQAQQFSKDVFLALELYGMARVDLFLEKATGRWYFNEVNTIPGFTEISQFPLLWQASGREPHELVERLIDLAIERRRARSKLKRQR